MKKQTSEKSSNPIYIQFQYQETIDNKKNVLMAQATVIRIQRAYQTYKILRSKELAKKQKLKTKTIQLKKILKDLQENFPKLKIPDILKDHQELDTENSEIKNQKIRADSSLESELETIQRKLRELK